MSDIPDPNPVVEKHWSGGVVVHDHAPGDVPELPDPRAGELPLDHPDSLAGSHDHVLQRMLREGSRGEPLCAALSPVWPTRSMMCTQLLGHHKVDDDHLTADGAVELARWPVVVDPATLPKSRPMPLPASDQAADVPEWEGT